MILYPFFSVGHLYLGTTTAGITVSSTASAASTISDSKKVFVNYVLFNLMPQLSFSRETMLENFASDDFRFRTASTMYGENGSKKFR